MKEILLNIIMVLHVLFILFVVITPFTNSTYFLFLHVIFIPFLILHWIMNDNTCVLTIMERRIRQSLSGNENIDDKDCFTCRLIEPVYDFKKNYDSFSTYIYVITIGLWLISVYKLFNKYRSGQINGFQDLFIV